MDHDEKTADIITGIMAQYAHAVEKHPVFDAGRGIFHCVSILLEEAGEVAQAVNDGHLDHAVLELEQVAAVCIRFVEWIKTIDK